jgi:hypothetical protein
MIRPLTLAVMLALVGCQSADVQRARPGCRSLPPGGPTLALQPGGGVVAQFS